MSNDLEPVWRLTSFEEDARENPRLEYWLSRPPEERVEAVEFLRRQVIGGRDRIQRVLRVLDCPWGYTDQGTRPATALTDESDR